jgi:Icc-related predicted phosphoesterase
MGNTQKKIVCFADTHGHHNKLDIPEGDILIFAGDFTGYPDSDAKQLKKFDRWLGKLGHMHKIIIPGNHDFLFERDWYHAVSLVDNAICLNDSMVEVEGLKIWGSPITPTFLDWAFLRARGKTIARHWAMIPDDIDILVTHGPPYGIMDLCPPWRDHPAERAGCEDLLKRIKELKNLKLHVFGHIHEEYGTHEQDGVTFVNCSKGYHPIANPPIVVELPV